jgi:hypothetical protein
MATSVTKGHRNCPKKSIRLSNPSDMTFSWSRLVAIATPEDQHGTKIFRSWHPGPTSWDKMHGASFLGQTTIRTRQIMLGFYRSVQITSQFMSHDWELLVCMESQWRSEYFIQSYWKFGQNNVAENDEAIFSICHIWPRDVIESSKIKAVPRQSFVIHPNGCWWQSPKEWIKDSQTKVRQS